MIYFFKVFIRITIMIIINSMILWHIFISIKLIYNLQFSFYVFGMVAEMVVVQVPGWIICSKASSSTVLRRLHLEATNKKNTEKHTGSELQRGVLTVVVVVVVAVAVVAVAVVVVVTCCRSLVVGGEVWFWNHPILRIIHKSWFFGCCSHEISYTLGSLRARPWKPWWSEDKPFLFGSRPIFRGELLNFQGGQIIVHDKSQFSQPLGIL